MILLLEAYISSGENIHFAAILAGLDAYQVGNLKDKVVIAEP
jgi:hypothetical protein